MSPPKHSEGEQKRQAAKRESIIVGAIKAFEQEGFERASMDRVAELAGASKRTVYNYFSCKEELLKAVIEKLMAGQYELKKIDYSNEESLESQLGRFVDAELYFVTDSSRVSLARLLTSIFLLNAELREQACEESPSKHTSFISWLKAASEDRRLDVKDAELTAQIFYGIIEGLFNFPALYRPLQTEKELQPIKEEAIKVFLSRYGMKS